MNNTAVINRNPEVGNRRMAMGLAVSLLVLVTGVATSLMSAFAVVA